MNFIFAHKPTGTNTLIRKVTSQEAVLVANKIMHKNNWNHVDCVLDVEHAMKEKYPFNTTYN